MSLRRLAGVLTRHQIAIPGDVAAALRTLATIEESLTRIDPNATLIDGVRQLIPGLMADTLAPQRTIGKLAGTASIISATTRRLPERVESTSRRLEAGTLTVRTRILASPDDRSWISWLVFESISSVLACAATIAAVLLILSDDGPMLTTTVGLHPFLGFTLLFAGVILAFRATMRMFTSAPPERRPSSATRR